MKYGLQGPNHAVTTACTTGAHSLGDASRFIKSGEADVMIAGGAEACVHPLALGGFARSRSLATAFNDEPRASSRPFDKDRDGFVIGEGAACVVLEVSHHPTIATGLHFYHCPLTWSSPFFSVSHRNSNMPNPEVPGSTPNSWVMATRQTPTTSLHPEKTGGDPFSR